MSSVTKFNVQ